jgi:dolichol-phosphate mannosyltransferase
VQTIEAYHEVEEAEAAPSIAPPLLFVIPALNEEANLPRLFEDLEARRELLPVGSRVIVVDDGSEDATPAIVEAYGGDLPVELLRFEENQGPGAAFAAGFASALEGAPDDALVVTMEADTTSDLDALPRMLARATTDADVVLADWQMVNVSAQRRLLSAGAGFVVRHALGLDAKTVSSFFRVYRVSVLRAATERFGADLMRERGFACKAEILAKLASMHVRIVEEPVALDWSRRDGESKMPVLKTMLAYWRMLFRQRAAAQEPAGL